MVQNTGYRYKSYSEKCCFWFEILVEICGIFKILMFQVVGYFESEDSDEFRNFQVSGDELVESCHFYAAIGDIAKPEMKQGPNVVFKNKMKNRVDRPFYGKLADREQFKKV